MFAIVRLGNQQFKVKAGDFIRAPYQDCPVKREILLPVVAFGSKNFVFDPDPLKNSHVKAIVIRQSLSKKILVFKKKRRKGYRRTKGHRQKITELKIMELRSPEGQVSQVEKAPKAPIQKAKVEKEPKAPVQKAKAEKPPKAPIQKAKAEKAPKAPVQKAKAEKAPKAPTKKAKVEKAPKTPTKKAKTEKKSVSAKGKLKAKESQTKARPKTLKKGKETKKN